MRSWPSEFAPVCGAFSRLVAVALLGSALLAGAQAPASKAPLIVLLEGDAALWRSWCAARGWQLLTPWSGISGTNMDQRVRILADKVAQARTRPEVDPARIYLAAQGDGTAALFYSVSREPDLWAAAVALGGTPRPAIDSNRFYAVNTTLVPLLWLFSEKELELYARKLAAAGVNLEWRLEPAAKPDQVLDWLASHRREPFPARVDCETGSRAFAHCYWVEMTRFDAAERNDVLESTRVQPGSGASLDLGGFGFNPAEPGPGVRVGWLPENYSGPLKLNDRIVSISGKQLRDGREYVELMDQTVEEKPVAVMVQRGNDRIRLETRIVLPKRDELATARVRAEHLPDLHEIQVLSRAVTQMRVEVPASWAPVKISWNGTEVANSGAAGCWLLEETKGLLAARKCP